MKIDPQNANRIILCRKGKCCPIVEKQDDGTFTITDDYNGKIKLTADEMNMLVEAKNKLIP